MYANTISNVARKGENKQDNIFYNIIILSIFLLFYFFDKVSYSL